MSSSTLILGASGFLGSNLAHHLEEMGEKVTRASRTPTTGLRYRVSSYKPDEIKRLLDATQPSSIVNCVGVVGHRSVEQDPASANSANVALPARLAQIALERGLRFVHFSSDSVYSGAPEDAPFSEQSAPAPFSLYGKQKAESEILIFDKNPNSLVFRVNFFGWSLDGKTGILDYFVSRATSGRPAIGYANYSVSSLHSKDLARIILLSLRTGLFGIYNVGSTDSLTKLAFGQNVYQLIGANPTTLTPGDPSSWNKEGIKARNLSMSSAKLEKALSITMPSQVQGIGESVSELPGYLRKYNLPHRLASFNHQKGQQL